jgi:hypothetical protein
MGLAQLARELFGQRNGGGEHTVRIASTVFRCAVASWTAAS